MTAIWSDSWVLRVLTIAQENFFIPRRTWMLIDRLSTQFYLQHVVCVPIEQQFLSYRRTLKSHGVEVWSML